MCMFRNQDLPQSVSEEGRDWKVSVSYTMNIYFARPRSVSRVGSVLTREVLTCETAFPLRERVFVFILHSG